MNYRDGLNKAFEFAFFLFIFFLPIQWGVATRLMVISVVLGLITWRTSFAEFKTFFLTQWNILYYLFILSIGLIYSTDIKAGFSVLETNASFVLLPLLVARLDPDHKMIRRIAIAFVMGVIAANIVCLVYAVIRDVRDGAYWAYYHSEYTHFIKSHPVYLGYFICFAITYLMHVLVHHANRKTITWIILALVYLFYSLVLVSGRAPFVTTIIILCLFVGTFIFNKSYTTRLKYSAIALAIVSLAVIVLFLLYNPYLIDKFFLNEDNIYYTKFGGVQERLTLWKGAISANTNFLFGVGTGDYKTAMNQYFLANNLPSYAAESYNSHNQYTQIYLSNGFLGVTAILLMLFRPLWICYREKYFLGFLTFFPFVVYGISEVFLGRFQGVVFFSFLHSVFLYRHSFYLRNGEEISKNRKVNKNAG